MPIWAKKIIFSDEAHFDLGGYVNIFLIPVLLYESEIFANCDTDDRWKLNLAYNSIARYIFIKGCRAYISQFSYRLFEVNFDNLLSIKCLINNPSQDYYLRTVNNNYFAELDTLDPPAVKKIIQ